MNVAQFINQIVTLWNAHDRAGSIAVGSDTVVLEGPGGLHLTGHAGMGQFYDTWNEAFPDNRVESEFVFGAGAEHGHGVLEARVTGTHTGILHDPSGDIPPTGRTMNLRAAVVYHIQHQKMTSAHIYFDQMELLTQLGLTPQQAAAAAG